jgi:hypothetical protein
MKDAGIGRVLVAGLHQAIADLLPTRLEFYENWLNPEKLRNGRIGLAPLAAVLSFLRRENGAYDLVTVRAGEYAADWTMAELSWFERAGGRWLPASLRTRLALRVARRLVRDCYPGSRAILRFRRGAGRLDVRGSVFCAVRQQVPEPLCGFYAAAASRLFERFGIPGQARVTECLAVGDPGCHVTLVVHPSRTTRNDDETHARE